MRLSPTAGIRNQRSCPTQSSVMLKTKPMPSQKWTFLNLLQSCKLTLLLMILTVPNCLATMWKGFPFRLGKGKRRQVDPEKDRQDDLEKLRKPNEEVRKLREEIQESICNSYDDKRFLPAGQIDKLADINRISTVLSKHVSDELVTFVLGNARKIFLALVLCGDSISANDLASIMRACQARGMSDKELPVPQGLSCLGCGDSDRCDPGHNRPLEVLHDGRWKFLKFRFLEDQRTINPPVFKDAEFVYELTADCVLPFTSTGPSERHGHFSTVSEAILHQDHYVPDARHGGQVESRKPIRVAWKKMKHLDEPGYDVEKAWRHEVSALRDIRSLRHKHLIRPLAAIKHGREHSIMFEWADGGSLRDFWKKIDTETLTADRVMCVLEQLHGLAGALAELHNTNNRTKTGLATRGTSLLPLGRSVPISPVRPVTPPPDARKPAGSALLQVPHIHVQRDSSDDESRMGSDIDRSYASDETDLDGEVHWRHGDLKPDNILQFRDPSANGWLGTLKIADLGLAKQHILQTSRRYEQTQQRYTTSQYEAPEAMANLHAPRSRRYDIWSMGCVIFEFVIFLLYGPGGLEAFYDERKPRPNSTDTLYFTLDIDQDMADVSGIASYWITQILKNPECSRKEESAIADLIILVKDRLLVVGLPEENSAQGQEVQYRADAGELQARLGKIWMTARDSEARKENYLLAKPVVALSPIPRSSGLQETATRKETGRYLRAPGQAQRQNHV